MRYLLAAIAFLAAVGLAAGWWVVCRALPQLDGAAPLPGLQREVTVDRDAHGVPHIRANSLEDLLTAQGYVLAQDRLWQMDILRRAAAGELSEVFGPQTLTIDREFRTLGLSAAATREAANLQPLMRALLEAYAHGVNRYIEQRSTRLPWEFVALRYRPRPWQPADSLLVAAYMFRTLTESWPSELLRAQVASRVGPERAREMYAVDSPLDHYLVGGSASASPGRPAPPAKRTTTSQKSLRLVASRLWPAASRILNSFEEEVRAGSNNWVVDGTHTASGKPLLANDTHLPLSVPCIWYIVHLTAPGWNVKGVTLPGVPGVVLGHNERIAWGATNSGADVQDLYIETLHPAKPLEYRMGDRWVAATVRKEVIHVRGQKDEVHEVVITRHGPIVRREEGRAYALRWLATEPGELREMSAGYFLLGHARNWQEFLDAAWRIPGPAQNLVYADVDGNIGFVLVGRIPVRRKGDGAVPVPGDTDDYEWTGHVPFEQMPRVLNPPDGIIATANARVAGPGYPHFLTERWVAPYRTARIYSLLKDSKNLRPADCLTIQTDILSLPHRFLAEQLFAASRQVEARDPRARKLLSRLEGWDGMAKASSVEMAFVEFTRRALLRNLLQPYLGGDTALYRWWRDDVFLENVLRERPAHWLPAGFQNYGELLVGSADQAAHALEAASHSARVPDWRWGQFIQLEILHPLGRSGWLRGLLGVGPIEQSGAANTVKQTSKSFGPAKRFVVDLSNFDNSLLNITLGESGQLGSPYYRDQFAAWFEGRGIPSAFSEAAEEKARVHRLRLVPGGNR